MTLGKCYSLNPDRGTQRGWINNNALDSWWWREVSCGENIFLRKGVAGTDFYYKNNIDDDRKLKLFYDALGRRTEVNPNTRRYLFEAKRDKTATMEIRPEITNILKYLCNAKVCNYKLREACGGWGMITDPVRGHALKIVFLSYFHGTNSQHYIF